MAADAAVVAPEQSARPKPLEAVLEQHVVVGSSPPVEA
jgi:hypothetical protein